MQAHSFSKSVAKYCAAHPGEEWSYRRDTDGSTISSGHCPSMAEKASITASIFMSRHKDFIACPENSKVMTEWLEARNLNPLDESSFERAYKDLGKSGQLRLYSK